MENLYAKFYTKNSPKIGTNKMGDVVIHYYIFEHLDFGVQEFALEPMEFFDVKESLKVNDETKIRNESLTFILKSFVINPSMFKKILKRKGAYRMEKLKMKTKITLQCV